MNVPNFSIQHYDRIFCLHIFVLLCPLHGLNQPLTLYMNYKAWTVPYTVYWRGNGLAQQIFYDILY